jgi:hypothetical protein
MLGTVYIKKDKIGTVNFMITDETMGAIGGILQPSELYYLYQQNIQTYCDDHGVANMEHIDFRIILDDSTILDPDGGIGITDIAGIEEIYVECAGLDDEAIAKLS